MEKVELTKLIIEKFNERGNEVVYTEGAIEFKVNGVSLPDNRAIVSSDFIVGGDDKTHVVRFIIKCPVSVKGDYNQFLELVNEINSSITTGKYFLEGKGDNATFCSAYDTTFFNTQYEKMNVERTMMFMYDSLLMEYADILKRI